jgi:hypothetical protein
MVTCGEGAVQEENAMPSITTVFRAIVMIATGVIVVKGWQHYGPSNEQVKTFAVAALEKAQTVWNGSPGDAASASSAIIDPRSGEPSVLGDASPIAPTAIAPAPQLVPLRSEAADTATNADNSASPGMAPLTAPAGEQLVAQRLAQLQQLGAADAKVAPWGSSGQLFRCCCRAKLAESSPLARHFEAVAGEPTAAVEQVVAKVEAWRTEQQKLLR